MQLLIRVSLTAESGGIIKHAHYANAYNVWGEGR